MTSIGVPQCESCKHLHRNVKGYTCEAFPEGIPEEIITGEHDHRNAFPGDNGIMYEKSQPEGHYIR